MKVHPLPSRTVRQPVFAPSEKPSFSLNSEVEKSSSFLVLVVVLENSHRHTNGTK
jgi:hypothetical protein